MTAIQPQGFSFENHDVRVVNKGDEPWFVGADVCKAIGIVKTDRAMSRLDNDEKGTHIVSTIKGNQELTIISEAGVYHLALTSRTKRAKPFRRWVTHEVLPEIRKTGRYEHGEGLTPEHQRELQELIGSKAQGNKGAYSMIYGKLKSRFRVGSYKDIPEERFKEARSLVESTVIEGELLRPEKPESEFPALRRDDLEYKEAGLEELGEMRRQGMVYLRHLEAAGVECDGLACIISTMHEALVSYWTRIDEIRFQTGLTRNRKLPVH